MTRDEAQRRADQVRAFRAELAALSHEGVEALPADRARAIAAHHDAARHYRRLLPTRLSGLPPYVTGSIDSVAPGGLHVPRAHASIVRGRRFRLSVLYGRRFEPWIAGASR
ncbi:MAG: hypothetical protein ACRD26_04640 [Vicinamibacterales bacterium]